MRFLIILTILLSACGKQTNYTGSPSHYNETCVNGVVYYMYGHHFAPAFKPDGTLYICNGGKAMTDINKLKEEAIKRIDSMSVEELRETFIKNDYKPDNEDKSNLNKEIEHD
jgi:hypothetical protein